MKIKNKSKIALIIGIAAVLVSTAAFAWANENLNGDTNVEDDMEGSDIST